VPHHLLAREWRLDPSARPSADGDAGGLSIERDETVRKGEVMYEKPVVQRLGSLRERTLGLGPNLGGDPASVYHRS
jgi:hypothetical protein